MERKLGKLQPYCLEWSPDAQVARKFFELWWIVHVHWWVYDYFPQFRDKMMSNSYHEWTMCLLMCILIACVFLSESIAFVQRVQTWKRRYVMCKRLFDCIATRARLMIFERLQGRNWTTIVYIYIYTCIDQSQSNRINTMEQKQVDMRQVCCDINQPHKKEWHWGECNLRCYGGL